MQASFEFEAGDVVYLRSARARRYRLTLRRDGTALATIPARGSRREAERFVAGHREWLERARARQRSRPRAPERWAVGTAVLWRGEMREIRAAAPSAVALAADVFPVADVGADLRVELEAAFVRRARAELPERVWALAAQTGSDVKRVTVRNQRSLWGSCSRRGTISLNWRLVRTPDLVRDYLICHELMHLREMNHSDRFWRHVQDVFPRWREAERWLKEHAGLVGM